MVDPELVAIGAEAPARLTDLGVMPEPGGEGEEPQPDAGPQARACAGAAQRVGTALRAVGEDVAVEGLAMASACRGGAGQLLARGLVKQAARSREPLQLLHLEPLAVHGPPDRPEVSADHPRLQR